MHTETSFKATFSTANYYNSHRMTITEAHLKSTHQVASDVKEVFGVCKETIFPAGQKIYRLQTLPKNA